MTIEVRGDGTSDNVEREIYAKEFPKHWEYSLTRPVHAR